MVRLLSKRRCGRNVSVACKFVAFLLRGMTQGFRIGFDRDAVILKAAKCNMRSTGEAPEVVQAYLHASRVFGLIHDETGCKLVHIHCNTQTTPDGEVEVNCGSVTPPGAQSE